jgi:predicted polyphosphate/ATP-dependent NAD kinase
MSKVGIIANPSSGKDIRQIVAQGWVVTNQEKVAITRRLLSGLAEAGVREVIYMPEPRGICPEALTLFQNTALTGTKAEIPVTGSQQDSTNAAKFMSKAGVGCVITLGGDGTNRAVFKGLDPEIPVLPVSTGTNNVFPEFQEGTTAGYAAGLIATGQVGREQACWRSKVLHVYQKGKLVDLALVDLAVATDSVIGARAIWEVSHLKELFLTRAQPWSIGLSAIGGVLDPLMPDSPYGLHLLLGENGRKVKAPIGPGLFAEVGINHASRLTIGEQVMLQFSKAATLAFDGERDLTAFPGDELLVELNANGPWVVDLQKTLSRGQV